MGVVCLGFTPGGRPVAVKVVRPELGDDPEFRARFRQEVAPARRVHGLFTAPVVDANPEASPPWLAATYVAGPSLTQAVKGHGPLPAHSVLLLVAGVAEALSAIHGAGLVHRDLKPSNVLLAADRATSHRFRYRACGRGDRADPDRRPGRDAAVHGPLNRYAGQR